MAWKGAKVVLSMIFEVWDGLLGLFRCSLGFLGVSGFGGCGTCCCWRFCLGSGLPRDYVELWAGVVIFQDVTGFSEGCLDLL